MHDPNPAGGAMSAAVASYVRQGSGGRQPIAYVGPAPSRRPEEEFETSRRPVVAVLDTGCGDHPWLKPVVNRSITLDGAAIGYTDDQTDPEKYPDQVGPLDGGIDEYSGHGTFICGLVHQACPDADILAWRIVGSDGPIVESDLVDTLADIAELVRRHRDGEEGGRAIDVLNLSMGYYHETPDDLLFDPTMYDILKLMGECGTVVVCSAGNDATARPMFPAAFAPWEDGRGTVQPDPTVVPVVSVGALNPNGTDALFTNTGPWVRAYAPGASVMSTTPAFQGGWQPLVRTEAYQRIRETEDPDDYTSMFAVWSGTSFAAPLLAGRIASALSARLPPPETAETASVAVARGWKAVSAVTPMTP
jgi:subtilisin family serine protease